jgi:hypothetical protein
LDRDAPWRLPSWLLALRRTRLLDA